MRHSPSAAERLDRAVDAVLGGLSPVAAAAAADVEPAERPLVHLADELHDALVEPPVAPRFEARLGTRLAAGVAPRDPVAWARRHRGPLIVSGAVGSAFGVGVTAYAVWRSSRRSGAAARLLPR